MSFEYTIFTGGPGGKIQTRTVTRALRPDDVVIKVTHSGLCFTDVHVKHRAIALGHEGAGVIIEVGPAVQNLRVGDRVGFGICAYCRPPGGSPDVGSLASHALISETFAYKIPDDIPSAHAAPFMCAGASVFEPLFRGHVRPGSRVGVLGVGGLGHLAIQFARAMGCIVVVFSTTNEKREEAFQLGAHEFVVFKGVDKLDVAPVKHLLVVSSYQPDWKLFMPVLAPRATIYPLTIDLQGNISIPAAPFISNGMRLQGTEVAPRSVFAPMLAFASASKIKPMVEEFPMTTEGIAQAFEALQAGKLRYRAVLVAQD